MMMYENMEFSVKDFSLDRKLLAGAYFTNEYSNEAAALFNPSIVVSPDQSKLSPGQTRCIMSLRAAGEGHISSIVFRNIILNQTEQPFLEETSKFAVCGDVNSETESGADISFDPGTHLSERVLYPVATYESNGMEDVRWVEFKGSDHARYFATYTAYDGKNIRPVLLQTNDFLKFNSTILKGSAAVNKNLALFPRKVNGEYQMLGRIDGRNHYILRSDDLYNWSRANMLSIPYQPWEIVQVGNNGSPIETDDGWLVITHGVGPMRRYCLGAMLLDLDDPTKVIGKSKEPIMEPTEEEREGYVPNVLYTCGAVKIEDLIYLPYAASDRYCGMATFKVSDVVDQCR
jgi:predicted GH43/DUF377 family glycosyl hydrolase